MPKRIPKKKRAHPIIVLNLHGWGENTIDCPSGTLRVQYKNKKTWRGKRTLRKNVLSDFIGKSASDRKTSHIFGWQKPKKYFTKSSVLFFGNTLLLGCRRYCCASRTGRRSKLCNCGKKRAWLQNQRHPLGYVQAMSILGTKKHIFESKGDTAWT